MKNLVKDNLQSDIKFNGTMRYIDDLLTLNDSGFTSRIPYIFPPELDLKKTTENYIISYHLFIYGDNFVWPLVTAGNEAFPLFGA